MVPFLLAMQTFLRAGRQKLIFSCHSYSAWNVDVRRDISHNNEVEPACSCHGTTSRRSRVILIVFAELSDVKSLDEQ